MSSIRILLTASFLIGMQVSEAHPTLHFYLTQESVTGDQPVGACETGFHMASAFELIRMDWLVYDTARGRTEDDSGHGPPSGSEENRGWIRTGRPSQKSENCSAWTTRQGKGLTLGFFKPSWSRVLHPSTIWRTEKVSCSDQRPVWCIQDQASRP